MEDSEFMQQQMLIEFKKAGKNNDCAFKASYKWLTGFLKCRGMSRQKKTNKKSRSLEERMPQIRNFHWYTIYQMATEDPKIKEKLVAHSRAKNKCLSTPPFIFFCIFNLL